MIKENFVELYSKSFKENWDLPALTDYFKHETFYYRDVAREIAKLHLIFEQCCVKQGDKIAIVGRNNPRWCISFLATITYGAIVVPILQDFNANDIQHIINHSDAVMLFSGDQHWDLIDEENVPQIIAAFSLTDFGCLFEKSTCKSIEIHSPDALKKLFVERYPEGFSETDVVYPQIPNSNLVLINYTSGTTGFSKGVMLTANNLASNVTYGHNMELMQRGDKMLSILPLAHAYGCMFEFLYPLSAGAEVTLLGKIPSPKILLEALAEVQPHIIIAVPLIIEKIYRKQILPLLDKNVMKLALMLPIIEDSVYAIIRKKLQDAFGGRFRQIIVGGAPLNADVEEFMLKIKFPITVGYGMTECAPLISYSPPESFVAGSCGRAIDYVNVRIDSADPENVAGEICVKGENVMIGYYKNEAATKDIFDSEGWLHTGDIGTMDIQGNIHIRGRNKTMILRANGQNIYPEEIEAKLNNLLCVMECLVVDRDGRLIALVYPDYDQLDAIGLSSQDLREIMDNNMRMLNELVAPYERIAEIILYPNEFEKTPKKSIKRYLYNV